MTSDQKKMVQTGSTRYYYKTAYFINATDKTYCFLFIQDDFCRWIYKRTKDSNAQTIQIERM